MKKAKKILSIILLVVFLFNMMGYYVVFKVNQSIIRLNIRSMINSGYHKEMFTLIIVDHSCPSPYFKRLDHDEFSYKGRLYDIISESVKGKTTIFYCVNDFHEEQLIARFERVQSLTSAFESSGKTNHFLAFMHNLITIALVNDRADTMMADPFSYSFKEYSNHTVSAVLRLVSPPPEFS